MTNLLHAVAELCLQMERATALNPVREILRSASEAFGSGFFLFGMRSGRRIVPPQQIVLTNYPKRWQRRYDELGARAFDPVMAMAFQARAPFRWDDLHQDERQRQLRRESISSGMEFGFSVPDRGADDSIALLSFCGPQPIVPDPAEWERAAVSASLLAGATHRTVARIIDARQCGSGALGQALSHAERRCLEMMAAAMTADEAAALLGVRPRTVRYYLDRAAEKLGVQTRKEAVMKALADRIIDTRRFPDATFGEAELHG